MIVNENSEILKISEFYEPRFARRLRLIRFREALSQHPALENVPLHHPGGLCIYPSPSFIILLIDQSFHTFSTPVAFMTTKRFLSYLLVFLLGFGIYAICAGKTLFLQSSAPHYVYQAYSFLHGRIDLLQLPPSIHDLISFEGKWYVPGAPAPAIIMMLPVAILGLKTSDIFFNVLLAAINVVLIYDLLGLLASDPRLSHPISESLRRWLTLFFALGTTHWYLGALGSVLFNAQLLAVACMILFVRDTLTGASSWRPGFWLGIAFMARPTTIFAITFYFFLVMLQNKNWKSLILRVLPTLCVLGVFVAVTFAHNFLRFHSPGNFGYEYAQGRPVLIEAYRQFGGFNPVFIPCNLYVATIAIPFGVEIFPGVLNNLCAHLISTQKPGAFPIELLGSSMFLTMPPLFYLFRARWRDPLVRAALLACLSIFVPLLLYHNTGASQFGYRYSLDMIVFLLILVASGIGEITARSRLIIIASIFINLTGFLLMFYYYYGYEWFKMWW